VRLAPGDVGVQLRQRADTHRRDVGDLGETLDLTAGESNLVTEADHGACEPLSRAILAEPQTFVVGWTGALQKISDARFQCHPSRSSARPAPEALDRRRHRQRKPNTIALTWRRKPRACRHRAGVAD
jgi:hypothetical protein